MSHYEILRHRQRVSLVFAFVAFLLGVGWPISALINWADIIHTPARLGYVIADMGLVLPLCILTYMGLQREAAWGPLVSLLAMGALAYDTVHFGVFLIKVQFLHLSPVVYLLLMATILYVLFRFAYWEIRLAMLSPVPR